MAKVNLKITTETTLVIFELALFFHISRADLMVAIIGMAT